jgi:hypothetical protein
MILHAQGQSLLEWLSRSGMLVPAAIASAVERHPRFQNIDYPLALPPLLLNQDALPTVRKLVESYVALLEKVVRIYRVDMEVRRFFGLGGAADELIDAEGDVARAITICRLDGYIEHASGRLQILENNADAPAGTLFNSRLNRLTRELIADRCNVDPMLPMDDGDPFLDTLLDAAAPAAKSGRPLRTAVLQVRGRSNKESHEIAAALRSRGHVSDVTDPRDLQLTDDGLVAGGGPLDVVWNKINMSGWTALTQEAPGLVDTFARAARHPGAPAMLNSYGARHVAETKTSLALLHDLRFADRFTAEERALVSTLVPWTVRLDRDAVVTFDGRDWPLELLVRERRQDLVLKQQYDIRGDGVTIGLGESPASWKDAVDLAWGTSASLQRYVKPARYSVQLVGAGEVQDCNVSLDSFVFNGRLVGLGAKASRSHKVNVFQGGSKIAVVTAPAA